MNEVLSTAIQVYLLLGLPFLGIALLKPPEGNHPLWVRVAGALIIGIAWYPFLIYVVRKGLFGDGKNPTTPV